MKDGQYNEQASGINRPLNLRVQLKDNKIFKIDNLNNDIPDLEKATLEKMSQKIIKNQSITVDAVSGATVSSNGIIDAIKNAILDADGDPIDFKKRKIHKLNLAMKTIIKTGLRHLPKLIRQLKQI